MLFGSTKSSMSLPESVAGVESITSEVESTISLENNQDVPRGHDEKISFRSGDCDIILRANGSSLETHKHILRKFSKLDAIISDAAGCCTLDLGMSDCSLDDFQNTFQILYASVVDGPFTFDSPILVSALRIASAYDYPTLRTFTIKGLEDKSLSAIERIRLAREFGLDAWEGPAYVELHGREEAITLDEAAVLGLDGFVRVAKAREGGLRRKMKETDQVKSEEPCNGMVREQVEANELEPRLPSVKEDRGIETIAQEEATAPEDPAPALEISMSKQGLDESSSGDDRYSNGEVNAFKPCFIDYPIASNLSCKLRTLEVAILGCNCEYNGSSKYSCKLPPCAVTAFGQLQTEQLAHKKEIMELRKFIGKSRLY